MPSSKWNSRTKQTLLLLKHACEMFAYYPLKNPTCQLGQQVQKSSCLMEDSVTMASRRVAKLNTDVLIFHFSYLATGDLYNCLVTRFHMGVSTVHNIVSHICHNVWKVMSPVQLKEPTVEEWQ